MPMNPRTATGMHEMVKMHERTAIVALNRTGTLADVRPGYRRRRTQNGIHLTTANALISRTQAATIIGLAWMLQTPTRHEMAWLAINGGKARIVAASRPRVHRGSEIHAGFQQRTSIVGNRSGCV